MSVTLTPSIPSPAPVATIVTFTASVADAAPGTLWYRFRSNAYDRDSHLIKDYGPENTLAWTASDHDGPYKIDVDVRNTATGETATAVAFFTLQSLVTGSQPVISPTSHPMVYLYSAPACAGGSRMRVQITSPEGSVHYTPFQPCRAGLSMNFYLTGMRGNAQFSVMHVIDTGTAFQNGPVLTLNTAASRTDLTPVSLSQGSAPKADGTLVYSTLLANPIATDLAGNLIWYYPNTDISYLTRPAPGGYFYAVQENNAGDQSTQFLRKTDLQGVTVLQTNAARVNEQLTAMGKRSIGAFHHEARRLADGSTVVLADVEQNLTNVQGPGTIDVVGDMILVLDPSFQVVWAWDSFDHLDTTRKATLLDQCAPGDCPPLFLTATPAAANDWTHGNSVQQTPDGNLLYSSRSQDWVIKIDYGNGSGSGNVIWRLGPEGDFRMNSTDPLPWFTHQHDPQFLPDNTTLVLFDNGNVRNLADPSQNSRGQALLIDEQSRTATLTYNADLGQFAVALGAAQLLSNGDYLFDLGYQQNGSYAVQVDKTGQIVFALNAANPSYRIFRMPDLYNPPYGTH